MKAVRALPGMSDDPLMHAISITGQHNSPVFSYIQSVLEIDDETFYDDEEQHAVDRIRNAPPSATRSHTYASLNPEFTRHPLYYNYGTIPDYLRITFTRFRLSSHMLRVETGR